jgi:hypothetical protein
MTDEARVDALTASRLCAAAAPVAAASIGLALVAFAALAFVDQFPRSAWAWWLVALLGVVAPWLALRLRFDAAVFADLAAGADVDAAARAFDAALAGQTGVDAPAPRSLRDRARGARRLVTQLVAIAAVQFIAALVAAFPG